MNTHELIDSLRNHVERLPLHHCAYCASAHTVLQTIEHDRLNLVFSIYCNNCNQIDKPMLSQKDIKRILMAVG